ncbi:hypothetical protein FOE67_00275 [Streptomyces calidiresistens]|uniref:Glucose-methanol-choline oxidoreductase N-terminal domain-containing protein n=1 Tax=Streptomyces calidiresistens TaxID=1485586 RepID=A0A7W3SZ71_9ACTN|nr:hypothetical protein [Streptomyces calidiresistens]
MRVTTRRQAHYDHVVVGAGSSGAVLAARPASLTDSSVLLLEVGPGYHERPLPATRATGVHPRSARPTGYTSSGPGNRDMWIPRGRVVGGCSVINTCVALRPEPVDFDNWPSGAQTWSWGDALNAFTAIETDANHGGHHHRPDRCATGGQDTCRADDVAVTRLRFRERGGHPGPPAQGPASARRPARAHWASTWSPTCRPSALTSPTIRRSRCSAHRHPVPSTLPHRASRWSCGTHPTVGD